MTIVYGPGIEPGGMELDNEYSTTACPCCGGRATVHDREACEGGSINRYRTIICVEPGCDYAEGNDGPDAPGPDPFAPD